MITQPSSYLELSDLDKRSYFHPFTSIADHERTGPWVIQSASGITIKDAEGQEYLDATSGLACVNVGYGREEIARAVYEQTLKLSFFPTFWSTAHEPAIRLADRLIQMTPGDTQRVMFGTSGSDANDTQIKLCWYYNNLLGRPGKKKIIARERAYHGTTIGATSLSGVPGLHKKFDLPIPQVLRTWAPDYLNKASPGMSQREFSKWLAQELDNLIEAEGPDTVAAFINEPVPGSSSGVLVPPTDYFIEIRKVLDKHDVLFIADEVVNGFGRVGAPFASTLYGLEPDLMTLSKGLTSGYIPMSAVVVSKKVWEVVSQASEDVGAFEHGFTNSGHPVCAAAALANLDILERENLFENSAHVGAYLQQCLCDTFADYDAVREIRGIGLFVGIELGDDDVVNQASGEGYPVQIMRECYKAGLIIRASPGNATITLAPPLIITKPEVDLLVERLKLGFDKIFNRSSSHTQGSIA